MNQECGTYEFHLWDKTEGWRWFCVRCKTKRRPRIKEVK